MDAPPPLPSNDKDALPASMALASELREWGPHRRGKFWMARGNRPASAQFRGNHEGQHDRHLLSALLTRPAMGEKQPRKPRGKPILGYTATVALIAGWN